MPVDKSCKEICCDLNSSLNILGGFPGPYKTRRVSFGARPFPCATSGLHLVWSLLYHIALPADVSDASLHTGRLAFHMVGKPTPFPIRQLHSPWRNTLFILLLPGNQF